MELFTGSNVSKRCDTCKMEFKNCMVKKNHYFLYHYHRDGGSGPSGQVPLNFLHRGRIRQYTINIDQHKNFYDFFDGSIVDDFIKSVYGCFFPHGN